MTIHHDDAFRLANLQLDQLRESAATARLRRRLRRRAPARRTDPTDRRQQHVTMAATPGSELRSVHR